MSATASREGGDQPIAHAHCDPCDARVARTPNILHEEAEHKRGAVRMNGIHHTVHHMGRKYLPTKLRGRSSVRIWLPVRTPGREPSRPSRKSARSDAPLPPTPHTCRSGRYPTAASWSWGHLVGDAVRQLQRFVVMWPSPPTWMPSPSRRTVGAGLHRQHTPVTARVSCVPHWLHSRLLLARLTRLSFGWCLGPVPRLHPRASCAAEGSGTKPRNAIGPGSAHTGRVLGYGGRR